jgi:hypothetical protein
MKSDIYDSFSHFKNDIQQNKKIFEDYISEKVLLLEKNLEKSIDDFSRNKEKIVELYERRKIDHDETIKQSKSIISSYAKELTAENNLIKIEIQKITNHCEEIIGKKLDKKEFELIKNKLYAEVETKVNNNLILVRLIRYRITIQKYSKRNK